MMNCARRFLGAILPRAFAAAILASGLIAGASSPAWAVFNLSVEPSRGGRDIRFEALRQGRAPRNEEVTITITSDEGKRYQVTQMLMSPLVSDTGKTLPPESIKMYSPTNVKGTLRIALVTPMRQGSDVMYTSNQQGESDAFSLILAIEQPDGLSAGIYQSQITYTLESVDGGVPPVTIVRNIRVDVVTDFEVEVKNARGGRDLDLGRITKDNLQGEAVLSIGVTSNAGNPYKIYQQLSSPLTSADGKTIDPRKIMFKTSAGNNGGLALSPQVLISGENGAGGTVNVSYWLEGAGEAAGIYESILTLSVESSFGENRVINVPIRIDISPIFYLEVVSDQGAGAGGLNFGSFSLAERTKSSGVKLRVFSNRGQRYQISQIVDGTMANEMGKPIDPKHFIMSVSGPKDGTLIASADQPVPTGETALYVSDSKGTPAELDVKYTLTIDKDQLKGTYRSNLTYSLSTS